MRTIFILLLICLPSSVFGMVSFSEVAWMGSAVNSNHEWIELHNSSASPVDVDGWQIIVTNDPTGENTVLEPSITVNLNGEIAAGAYVLLKRTSEASAPGPTFALYTGALVNTGATLTLRRSDGSVVDRVVGGENWQNIGGDNSTKDTAQYTSGGWVTAVPTPAAANQASITTPSTTVTTTVAPPAPAARSNRSSTAGEPVRLVLPNVSLQLAVEAQSIGYVGQLIDFSATPRGLGDTWLDSLQYEWNFGDGSALTQGKESSHRFMFPGTYVVTVWAGYARHEQVARHEITILPTTLSLTTDQQGNIQINNDAPYEVDVSGFVVRGTREIILPPRTILLPRGTITISANRIGNQGVTLVGVYDTTQSLIATNQTTLRRQLALTDIDTSLSTQSSNSVATQVSAAVPIVVGDMVSQSVPSEFSFVSTNTGFPTVAEIATNLPTTTTFLPVTAAADAVAVDTSTSAPVPTPYTSWPYLGLLLVLLIAIVGVYSKSKPNPPPAPFT